MNAPRRDRPSVTKAHPRKDYRDRMQLSQYRRGANNPTWEARFRIGGTWTGWTSLGTTEWDDALFVSVDKLAEREQMAVAGIHPPSRTRKEQHPVAEIAVITLARMAKARQAILATEPKKKAGKIDTKISRIKRLIIPAIGSRGITDLRGGWLRRDSVSPSISGTSAG
jgi:hypothetical protein